MRFIGRADLHPDFFDPQMSGNEQLTRRLQSPSVNVFDGTETHLFFEKTLEMGCGHIDRSRQLRDGERLREITFDFCDYFFYSVIHLFGTEEKKRK